MMPKCLLCGNHSQPRRLRSRKDNKLLTEWGRRMAVSLCQMLELDQTFEADFVEGPFCMRCQETVCNAEFTVNSISRLQCQLGFIRESIKSHLLSNYNECITATNEDLGSNYNTILERIVSRMGAMTKVEVGPSDEVGDMATVTFTESAEEFILPTSTPPKYPRRLADLKKRQNQKLLASSKSGSRKLTKSVKAEPNEEFSIFSTSSGAPQSEDTIVYSRSGRKIKPVFKISDSIFEERVSFSDDDEDDGMDFENQAMETSESESESEPEPEDENDEIQEKPKPSVTKPPRKRIRIRIRKPKPKFGADGEEIPIESKFVCNYETCLSEQLKFPRPRDVKTHLETVHGGEGVETPYHCPHCSHRTKNNEKLRRHALIHKEHRARLPCPTCGKDFLGLKGLKSHQPNCSGKTGSIKCKFCKKPFATIEELAPHLDLHSAAETPFNCVLCPAKLKTKILLAYHVKTIHEGIRRSRKYQEGVGPFPCNFPPCLQNGSNFEEVLDMKRHLAESHGQVDFALELIHHCTKCEDRFKYNRILQRHLKERHTVFQELPKDNLCSFCGKLFLSKPTLRQHLREVHNALRRKPKCSLCTKSCESQEDLLAHEQLHSPLTPHACVLCPQSFITTIDFHAHVYNTHEVLPYRCDEAGCGKGFETKLKLDYHMKTIHKPPEKAHQCPLCPFRAWGPSALKPHIRSHTQEKTNILCEVVGCGVAFVWKSQLTRHVRMKHGGPFTMIPCKICGKEFATIGLMKRHEVHHSDVRPFGCEICSARFKVPKHLKRHMLGHDKGGLLKGDNWKPRKPRLTPVPHSDQEFMPQSW